MHHIDTSDRREQRNFGLVMAGAITVIGGIRWALHGFETPPTYYLAVAAVFLVLGLALPKALGPLFFAWMKFALALNWLMTRVVLTIALYLMITPARVIMTLFKDDPLRRKRLPEGESYWEVAEAQPEEFDRYRKQY